MTLTCGCEVTVTAPARIERACEQHGRINLRDHFAGQALAGMHARDTYDAGQDSPEKRARLAYLDADAMLAARQSPLEGEK